MVSKICFEEVYQYFILLAFFRFPQFIGEYGGKAPDFWHADKALCGYKIIWSHYWEIQRSSTNLRSRGNSDTTTKKHFYRCSWTKRGKSTDYNVHENAVQNKCILGTSYNIFLNIGGRNKANEVYITWPCRETFKIFFNTMKQDDNTNLVTIVLASFTFTPWCDLSDCILWYTYTSGEGFVCHPMVSCPPPPPYKIILKNFKREGKIKQETGIIVFLYTSLSLWIALSLVYLYLTWAERRKEIDSSVKSYSWASLLPWVEENSATRIKVFFFYNSSNNVIIIASD